MALKSLKFEVLVWSSAYLAAFAVTFGLLVPLQNLAFPEFPSQASLLFLPQGVRVLAAWLLGWRAIPALLPAIFLSFVYLAGWNVFGPVSLFCIAVSAMTAPVVFWFTTKTICDLRPQAENSAGWPCVMLAGTASAIISGFLMNYVRGSAPQDYVAYFIGDIAGMFFLMMILMLFFRWQRQRHPQPGE